MALERFVDGRKDADATRPEGESKKIAPRGGFPRGLAAINRSSNTILIRCSAQRIIHAKIGVAKCRCRRRITRSAKSRVQCNDSIRIARH
jgi:hypothetical protein